MVVQHLSTLTEVHIVVRHCNGLDVALTLQHHHGLLVLLTTDNGLVAAHEVSLCGVILQGVDGVLQLLQVFLSTLTAVLDGFVAVFRVLEGILLGFIQQLVRLLR